MKNTTLKNKKMVVMLATLLISGSFVSIYTGSYAPCVSNQKADLIPEFISLLKSGKFKLNQIAEKLHEKINQGPSKYKDNQIKMIEKLHSLYANKKRVGILKLGFTFMEFKNEFPKNINKKELTNYLRNAL